MINYGLKDKVALITGANNPQGIGATTALAFAREGAKVVLVYKRIPRPFDKSKTDKNGTDRYFEANAGNADIVENKLKEMNADYLILESDISNEDAVKDIYSTIIARYGRVDILVNNAGIIKRIPMHEMSVEEFSEVIDIDLVAPFIMSKAVIPSMIERGGGKIINICSMMSELGRETVSAYAAAKGGLKMLTRNIASEYGAYNIQCNAIGPGYIATPQTAPLREPDKDGKPHPFDSFIISKTPAARWGTPEDLKGPILFLASEASDFVNGHVLYVDGGILAYIGKQPK